MRKLDKKEIVLFLYLTLVIARYILFYFHLTTGEFQKSFIFIVDHSFVIAILLFLRPFVDSVLANLLIFGIIIFKIELIAYNMALLIVPETHYNSLNCSYDVIMGLTLTIGIIVIVCRFFDKIVIGITKIIHAFNVLFKWKKQ